KDLPSLTEKIYFSEMTAQQKTQYEESRNYFRKKILESIDSIGEKKSQIFILRGLMQLRLIANHPYMHDNLYTGDSGKFDDIVNTLESVLAENHKVLVFSQFVRHLDMIAAHLKKKKIDYAYLTGQTKNRQQAVQDFKEDANKQVFLISLKAGGVGLTLTEADYVFMCDPWWNPAAEQQAINRAHRIGQDKSVFAYKFISKNTVEEKILQLQERKLQLSASLIDNSTGTSNFLSKKDIEILFS
ncbi:MAG: DEAD/DEAH box helicase, partial [Bacteroidia bacterium]